MDLKDVVIKSGDRVCLTKLFGMHQDAIKDGDRFICTLDNDIEEGKGVWCEYQYPGDRGIQTSKVLSVFKSITCMIVKTKNSMYLIEKLLEE